MVYLKKLPAGDKHGTIKQNALGRYYIAHNPKNHLAISRLTALTGKTKWVPHFRGIPTNTPIATFATLEEATTYCQEHKIQLTR